MMLLIITLVVLLHDCQGDVTKRIWGGNTTTIENAPYQVSLFLSVLEFHFCGGAIISQYSVLTAGHCVYGKDISTIRVRAGSTTILTGGSISSISNVYLHESFVYSDAPDYDVAVVELYSSLVYSSLIAKIPLGDYFPEDGTLMTVTGWGETEYGPTSYDLRMAELPLESGYVCALYYGSRFTDRQFCAGYFNAPPSTCPGDSGSPIVWNGTVMGLSSYTTLVCTDGPPVFTNVPYLYEWISDRVVWD